MNRGTVLALDVTVPASTTNGFVAYTEPVFERQLAQHEKLAICIQFDAASSTGASGSATVTPQHSPDGKNWIDMTAVTMSPALTPSQTAPVISYGSMLGTAPVMDRLRLKISGASTASFTFRCRVYVTCRDDG